MAASENVFLLRQQTGIKGWAEAANSGHPTAVLWVTSRALSNVAEESPIWALLWSIFLLCGATHFSTQDLTLSTNFRQVG